MDPEDTTSAAHPFPWTAVRAVGVAVKPVVAGVWRVLDRTALEDTALQGMVLAAADGYQVIPVTALSERFTFNSLEAVREAFTPEDG